jgi:hypothetical protein
MSLRIILFGNVYELCIGYKAPWFQQVCLFSIFRLWFDESMEVSYAEMIFRTKGKINDRE